MIRVTIQDADQAISFITERPTALRLIAGCSINPNNLDELLIATDIYQRGFAANLMADLMEFDKALHLQGVDFIHQEINQARHADQLLLTAFQVIDEITSEESRRARGCSLVFIDLNKREIHSSQDLDIPRHGEVRVQIGETETNRSVSYILPTDWKIERLD